MKPRLGQGMSVKGHCDTGRPLRHRLRCRGAGLLLSLLLAWPAGVEANNFTYTTNNGGLTITGYSGPGLVSIPSSFEGLPVVAIGDYAFRYRNDIISVTIREGMLGIGVEAFYMCHGLTNITIPNSLTNIGHDAFDYCDGLRSIEIPSSAIPGACFFGCSNLVSAGIGRWVSRIEGAPFLDCTGLAAVTVDPLNMNYVSVGGVLFDHEEVRLIQYPGGRAGGYSVPGSVAEIGEYAFAITPGLTSISIPGSVTNLGASAFYFCENLTNATLGSGLVTLGDHSLSYCSRLPMVAIPDGVKRIGAGAFAFCSGLTNVQLSQQLGSIGDDAFSWCAQLASITFPSSLTSIGTAAFSGCNRLASVELHSGITNLGDYALAYCHNLGSATGLKGLTRFGDSVFQASTSLSNVSINPKITSIGTRTFEGCSNLVAVVVPDSVTQIGDWAFSNSGLTNVSLGTNLASVGFGAFSGCRMAGVELPDSLTSLGDRAFYGCPELAVVNIPANLSSLGYEAFFLCPKLAVFAVDPLNSAFSSVDGVLFNKAGTMLIQFPAGRGGSYRVPAGVTIIGSNAFYACALLGSVIVPRSVLAIQSDAFSLATNVTALCFEGNAPGVGIGGVSGADKATVYYLPGTTGWRPALGGLPTRLWNPQIQTDAPDFGVSNNQFGFTITGTSNLVLVVEACADLRKSTWLPVGTNTLEGGSSYFSDASWTDYAARFYRLRPY